jgi:acetoin utilization deacetylase AcuC-like enzyme
MSNRTGFLYDERYQEHLTGNYHPEMPDRLPAVYKGLEDEGLLERLTLIKATTADLKWVARCARHPMRLHCWRSAVF